MKVQNIGGKIVSIGNVTILPGEVKPVPDSFANNAAVACLVEHKNITLISSEKKEPVTAQSEPSEEPPAKDPPVEAPPAKEDNDDGDKKPLSRMNKAELVEECRKLGIEVSPDDTNPVLVEKIKAATAE